MILTKYLIIHKLKSGKNLLINTLSGAVDIIDDKTKNILDKKLIPDDIDIVKKLKDRFYIFDNIDEERKFFLDKQNIFNHLEERKQSGLVLCPTYSCNLRCPYCFQDDDLHTKNDVMSVEQVEAAFSVMDSYFKPMRQLNDYAVGLFGGEPLQGKTKGIVEYIFNKCRKLSKQIFITTNGTNIKSYLNLLKQFKDLLLPIQITIDGPKQIHDQLRIYPNKSGSFDIISKNIDLLLENKITVRIRVNIGDNNVKNLPELLNYFEEKKWTENNYFSVHLAPVTSHQENGICATPEIEIFDKICELFDDLSILKTRYKTTFGSDMFRLIGHINRIFYNKTIPRSLPSVAYCEAALLELISMGPDNHIYFCGEILGNKEFSAGTYYPKANINEDVISQWFNRTVCTIEGCSDCNIALFCGGGCPVAALKQNGNARTPHCGNKKEVVKNYLEKNTEKICKLIGV